MDPILGRAAGNQCQSRSHQHADVQKQGGDQRLVAAIAEAHHQRVAGSGAQITKRAQMIPLRSLDTGRDRRGNDVSSRDREMGLAGIGGTRGKTVFQIGSEIDAQTTGQGVGEQPSRVDGETVKITTDGGCGSGHGEGQVRHRQSGGKQGFIRRSALGVGFESGDGFPSAAAFAEGEFGGDQRGRVPRGQVATGFYPLVAHPPTDPRCLASCSGLDLKRGHDDMEVVRVRRIACGSGPHQLDAVGKRHRGAIGV